MALDLAAVAVAGADGEDDPLAEQLWWEAFERHPSFDGYRKLIAETSTDPAARKEQAIAVLRHRLEAGDAASRTRNPLLDRSPVTTLVEILLYEGRAEEAWTAAVTHGCDDRTARSAPAFTPVSASVPSLSPCRRASWNR